jgi:transglutaminase-like putative cysteine protease
VLLTINHRTRYDYGAEVFLESHTIRQYPRLDPAVRLVDLDITIDPLPVVRADNLDHEGNSVVQVWFERPTNALAVETRLVIETRLADPFRFLASDPEWALPYVYPPGWGPTLAAYRRAPEQVTDEVRQIALAAGEEARRDQFVFPVKLAEAIHRDFALEYRPDGLPNPPSETVRSGRGSCRDLATVFVSACQAMGLAARFVSGYAYIPDSPSHELHAWGEVYLRGGGWRGFDPTQGLAVSDRHVVLAAAADPADDAPVTGSFRGDGVSANLTNQLTVVAG